MIGINADSELGVSVPGRITLGQDGSVIGEYAYPQILTAWGRLYSLLKSSFPADHYHTGKQLVRVLHVEDEVVAEFADGTHARGDMLIGCDGIRSCVRNQFLPEAERQYAGYIAWRGLIEESALSAKTHADLFGRFGFCLPPHEQMLGYPVAGLNNTLEKGKRRYNFVWYRPADEIELARLSTDDSGKVHLDGIPPPLISKAVQAEIREAAHRLLAPQFAEMVERTEQPFFQPIYDLESSQLAFGRVALLGDAAFVARPHCGMGVTKAAGDAIALVNALANHDVEEALQRYSVEWVEFGKRIVAHARHLGAYMQAQILTDHERKMAERYRTPEAVMTETAIAPDFAVH